MKLKKRLKMKRKIKNKESMLTKEEFIDLKLQEWRQHLLSLLPEKEYKLQFEDILNNIRENLI
jgi:hypothetical protein